MKELFLKIVNYGIKPNTSEDITEQIRLVNGISLLGVPISMTYFTIFAISGHTIYTLAFLCGIIIFSLPIFLNKWFGLNTGRVFVCVMAPFFFGFISVLCGREMGFYLGFLVISVPPIIIFPKARQSIIAISGMLLFLVLSVLGNLYIKPIYSVSFAMGIYLLNLFTVLTTTLTVVFIFKNELGESREHLREKNKEVRDSIQYARRIQDAILPPESYIKKFLPDIFLLYKPKDIVAGDFYWVEVMNDTVFVAAADCTGHGVPGAMVSVVCHNALNRAVREFNISETGKILDKVTDLILETFEKSENDVRDGMDISLLSINLKTKKIEWSGANNSLWYFKNGQHTQIAADKQPIGLSYNRKAFTTHQIQFNAGTLFYLFTDGFADQFGGTSGKKFMRKQLLEKVLSIQDKALPEQRKILNETLEQWRGKIEQIDDVTIIGLRV